MKLTIAALIVVLAVLTPTASAAKPPTPGQIAVYARGWIDGAAPPGAYAISVHCNQAYLCTARLNNGYCAHAVIRNYGFAGPWHHCNRQPPA